MAGQTAYAQQSETFSIGALEGGITLPGGIVATATRITTGTGELGVDFGDTGDNPAQLGGAFTGDEFDASRPIGPPELATRINISNSSTAANGATTGYANAIGYHIQFSGPIPAEYFYAVDVDGREWKASFAFNGTNFVPPDVSISGNSRLATSTENVAGGVWSNDISLPAGAVIPATLPITTVVGGSANRDPDDGRNQILFDYNGALVTDIVFLFGSTNNQPTSGRNSGISSLTLGIPEISTAKSVVATGPLQDDLTFDVTYSLIVENTGGFEVDRLSLVDNLTAASNLGAAFNGIVSPPVVSAGSSFTAGSSLPTSNGANYDGTNNLLLGTNGVLAIGDSYEVEFTVNVSPFATGAPSSLNNTAEASATPVGFNTPVTDNSDPDSTSSQPGGPGAPVVVTPPALPTPPTVNCDGFIVAPLSFANATLSSGANLQAGAVYDFTSVAPGVDAQVEILGFTNGASLSAIYNDGLLTDNLNPQLVPNPAVGGAANFRVSFINPATGGPAPLSVSATQIDIDGDGGTLREFVEFDSSLAQFTVDGSTELVTNASGPSLPGLQRFESTTTATAPGIDPTAEANIVRAIYTNTASFDYAIGTLGAGTTTRLTSTGFDCPALPNPVNTIPTMEADLVTTKVLAASSTDTPDVGDTVAYEITVVNNGPDVATNVSLTDSLPAGLTPTANNGSITDGSYNNGLWTIPALLNGETATLTLEGTVDDGEGGNTITNTLNGPATSDADDPSTAGDDLTESVNVENPLPSLSIEKVADSSGPFTVGDVITYTYTVTNDGDQIVRDIVITDTHNGSDPAPIPGDETLLTDAGTAGDSTDGAADGTWDVLAPGDVITFTGTYTVTAADAQNL